MMSLQLLFHNIGFGSGTLIALGFAIFVYFKDRTAPANIYFSLAFLSIAMFCGSHVWGVNVADRYLSRDILMGNVSVIWISCFLAHCSFALVNAVKKQHLFIIGMYTTGLFLSIIFILFPDTYLLPSAPKMYFPNYYVAGSLQWIMRLLFDLAVPVYFLSYLFYAYHQADLSLKNRLKYFFVSVSLGYAVGSIALPLVYNIQIDPAWSSFCVIILAAPMAYAIVRYDLLDIRIVAKKAFIFSVYIALASFTMFGIATFNTYIIKTIVGFPQWIFTLIAGCVATGIGYFVWNKFQEADLLKSEFITIVTHKLRSPLTSIKWSTEELMAVVPKTSKESLDTISKSVEHMVDLTNILADVLSEDEEKYLYTYEKLDLSELCKKVINSFKEQAHKKNMTLSHEYIVDHPVYVLADTKRLTSVLQILIDNAIIYTPTGGRIMIMLSPGRHKAAFSVTDSGIGIDKRELRNMFTRLYRSDKARATDTEGMGIGLYMARKIIDHHNGKMRVQSDGLDKGATFSISLPIKKA
jgi:signal transduction histidine kinase